MTIERDNKILKSSSFPKEKFYLFFQMLETDEYLFRSDEDNYIIGRGNPGYPIWIWLKKGISLKKQDEVKKELETYYLMSEENILTCPKDCYEIIKNMGRTKRDSEIGFLICKKVNDISLSSGFMDKPSISELDILREIWKENCQESFPEEKQTEEEVIKEIRNFIKSGRYYVWRDNKGNITSTAYYSTEQDMAKISHVYTKKEERNKGYATSLVYQLTKELLNRHYQPLLYTDYQYKPSNYIYQKIGYEIQEIFIKFKMMKEES